MKPLATSLHPEQGCDHVVISGVGVTAAGLPGREPFWDLLCEGRSATRRITRFDPSPYRSQVAGEVDIDDLPDDVDRGIGLLLAAGREALDDAGDLRVTPERIGVSIGTAVGPTLELIRHFRELTGDGVSWDVPHTAATPRAYPGTIPSSFAAAVAELVGAGGPVATFSSGCTSGIDAVAHGVEMIRRGLADVVFAGGADAPIAPISVASFDAIKATSADNGDPSGACKPFDARRDGFVLAEGAAVVVLERAGLVRARGAHAYAWIGGFGSTSNSYHMTGLTPAGVELARAVDRALADFEPGPRSIGYINAHGSGTVQNDRHETQAFKLALGDQATKAMISSIKSMVGHSLGAVGAIEIAACALALDRGFVPPTANLHENDPACDLDYVPLVGRPAELRAALSTASGFGGFQSAMVLGAGLPEEVTS